MAFFDQIPLNVIVVFCLTIGLAPFAPPHVVEKIGMLMDGTLSKPIDVFDLVMHGSPWVVLMLKLARMGMVEVRK